MKMLMAFLSFFAALSADIVEVTRENYNEITKSNLPVILDINAPWCHACQEMEPILQEMSEKYEGTIQFGKVDYDSQPELVKKFGVTALPTFVFLKPGQSKPAMKQVGGMTPKEFDDKIAKFLKK